MRNWYAEAIQIVTDEKTDFRALLIEVAKKHPKAVVTAKTGTGWEEEVRFLVESGQKINAIKVCRNATGMGLREAKEEVEKRFNC